MKKYYSTPSQDPDSPEYDPKVVIKRPLYSDNEEIMELRNEIYQLKKQLAEYQANDTKPEKGKSEGDSASEVNVTVQTTDSPAKITDTPVIGGLTNNPSGLKFTHVEPTAKAPSGGVISKPKKESVKAKASRLAQESSTEGKS